MKTFSGPYEGNPPVTGGFPLSRPVTRSFDIFIDLRLNKRLSKQSRRRWFETPSRSLWHHCNGLRYFCSGLNGHWAFPLQLCHNELAGVSNHQRHDYLFNRLITRRAKKTSKLRVTGLYVGNTPVTCEFPAQRASNAENVSTWWRHHAPANHCWGYYPGTLSYGQFNSTHFTHEIRRPQIKFSRSSNEIQWICIKNVVAVEVARVTRSIYFCIFFQQTAPLRKAVVWSLSEEDKKKVTCENMVPFFSIENYWYTSP